MHARPTCTHIKEQAHQKDYILYIHTYIYIYVHIYKYVYTYTHTILYTDVHPYVFLFKYGMKKVV